MPQKKEIKTKWTKPGLQSTEFWAAIGVTLLQITKVIALPPWAIPIVWGVYTVARGLAKAGGPEITEE